MNAWNLSRQSTTNCVSTDNLTINSFVTYKESDLCEVHLRFCSTRRDSTYHKYCNVYKHLEEFVSYFGSHENGLISMSILDFE